MQVIKLSATDSTNTYLKSLLRREKVPDFSVVWALDQQAGRGQPGSTWVTDPGKNLTISILKIFESLPATHHFLLNALVSLALLEALQPLGIPDLKVKWPNDIMSGHKKLCGILIENQLKGNHIARSIIGIGLNVNQRNFPGLERAGSLCGVTGRDYDLEEVLGSLLATLGDRFGDIRSRTPEELLQTYERHLFLKDIPATFQRKGGSVFQGIIRGVFPDGHLKMEVSPGQIERYDFKEITYLF